jgi:hypothetical protein
MMRMVYLEFHIAIFHIIEVRDRLSNNINSLYGIDAGGSLIQTTSENKFKR